MRETQNIYFGVTGQTLSHRVQRGRPSSASFKVFYRLHDDDSDEIEFQGSASVDSVSTTLGDAAGFSQSDSRAIALTDASGVQVGRLYRLSENGRKIWVEVTEVNGNDLQIRHPLTEDWTASAAFESTYVDISIDDTWVADEDHLFSQSDPNPTFRIRLEVTIDSDTHVEYAFFDLVRGDVQHHLTVHDLESFWPGVVHQLATDQRVDRGQTYIDEAYKEAQHRLHAIGLNEAGIRDNAAVDQFTLLVARRRLAEGGIKPPNTEWTDFLELARTAEDRYFEQHFGQSLRRDVATGTGGGADRPLAMPIWSK